LRLKLQTPLFVADALMGAAGARLQSEIDAARGELAALEAVRKQLARFEVRSTAGCCAVLWGSMCSGIAVELSTNDALVLTASFVEKDVCACIYIACREQCVRELEG
jgi:hypothetical protein